MQKSENPEKILDGLIDMVEKARDEVMRAEDYPNLFAAIDEVTRRTDHCC